MTTNNDYTSIDTKYTMCNLCNKKLCKASIRMHEKTKKHISNKVGHPPIENIPPDQDPTEENPNEEDISEVSIPTTPDIIELSPGEMFKDNEGNPFHVEVVGIRGDRKNTWFKANYSNSISSIYGNNDPQWVSKRIYKETKKSNTLFSKNNDYIFFAPIAIGDGCKKSNCQAIMYISYKAIIILASSSRTGAAKRFIDWADETLYTVQMGTERQRLDLIDTQFGFINTKNYYNLLKKAHGGRDVMSIYILVLCKYCDTEIGKTKAIPGDNEFVVKVGKGILSQRIADHKRNYSDLLQGREPEVMLHMQVPSHIAYKIEKEFLNEIRDIDYPTSFNINGTLGTNHPEFNKYSSHGQKRKELIVIPHMYLNNDLLHKKLQCIINANVADTVCLEKHYQDIIKGKDHVIQTLTSSLEVLKGALDYIRGKK